jgi:excisionase family DNA binding protein
MSSKIEIEKNCEYCGALYTARTLYTRYCSHVCNRKAYKANKRQEKIDTHIAMQKAVPVVSHLNSKINTDVTLKELLSVTECCSVLGISRGTIFRWIKNGLLVTYQHGTKHLIKKEDINKLFSNGK